MQNHVRQTTRPRGFTTFSILALSTALFWGTEAIGQGTEPEFPLQCHSTDLLLGPEDAPRAVIELEILRVLSPGAEVSVFDTDATKLAQVTPTRNQVQARMRVPMPLPADDEPKTIVVEIVDGTERQRARFEYHRPRQDWVLHFIAGFHYDPVWWNTQAHYTETGRYMDAHTGPGLTLVSEYLRLLKEDPSYRVAFHQLPYLKTFLESQPHRHEELHDAVKGGHACLVGGSYNEFSSTLISAEASVRNAIYGTLFQRNVLDGDGSLFWQCDVFGHDPTFPSTMSGVGHKFGAFARGPFHQWGAPRDQVNFPSEFYWMSPDGRKVLTHYMTGHYGYAYSRFAPGSNSTDLNRSDDVIAQMFADLKRVASTRHILLPMHMDFVRPLENLGDAVRGWNERYLSPQAIISTPQQFFAGVTAELEQSQRVLPVITRDMNPIYTGCAVSFADLKSANRECETTIRDAEIFATLAWMNGADYPAKGIDRALAATALQCSPRRHHGLHVRSGLRGYARVLPRRP